MKINDSTIALDKAVGHRYD